LCSKCHIQCSIPAFEGLLPEPHNTLVRTLLYCAAEWHAFAKLQLHTENTLNHLEELTTRLGRLVRKFRDVTKSEFATFELPRETQAQKRRSKAKETERASNPTSTGQKQKTLNLFTYKWHALADYVHSIRLFSGTDGFSTQLVGNSYDLMTCLLMVIGRTCAQTS
jgi:hypothetical protein